MVEEEVNSEWWSGPIAVAGRVERSEKSPSMSKSHHSIRSSPFTSSSTIHHSPFTIHIFTLPPSLTHPENKLSRLV